MKKIFLGVLTVILVGFCCGGGFGLALAKETGSSILDEYPIIDCNTGKIISTEEFKDSILKFDIIYSLESHGRSVDHLLQKEIIENGVANNKEVIFGSEHLRKNAYNHKMWVDQYREGFITFDQLKKNINILRGYPTMEPLFRLIGDLGIEAIPLNIPIPYKVELELISPDTVTVQYLRRKLLSRETIEEGFLALSDDDKKFLPKKGFKILISDKAYNYIFGLFDTSGGTTGTERVFVGYCIMNEVMARSIMDVFNEPHNSNLQMVVCVGRNHGIFNEGVRRSVDERRPVLKQVTVYPVSEDELIFDLEKKGIGLTHENAIGFLKREKFSDYTIFYKQNPKTSHRFKAYVNRVVAKTGNSVGLKLQYPVNCKIIGPFEARGIMGNSYSPSINGLYYEDTLYFIKREGMEITTKSAKELIDHEGVHALQDQHFDLKRLHKIQEESSADTSSAIQALIEGHAVWCMIKNSDNPHVAKMLNQPFISKRTGRLVPQETIFKYRYGGNFVKYLYEKGGWNLVNSAFEKLPESSEQIMHPEKYLAGERPLVVDDLEAPYGYRSIGNTVLGEIGALYVLLKNGVSEEEALKSTEGWAGDRIFFYDEEKTGNSSMYWATFWDRKKDVIRFFETYRNITTKNWGVEPQIRTNEDGSYVYSWIIEGKRRDIVVYFDNLNINITQKIEKRPPPKGSESGVCPSE